MRSHFNSGPNYKHLSYPSHTISLLLQVSLLVSACLFAYSICSNWGKSTLSHWLLFQRIMNCCFVLDFSGEDPMTGPHWAGGEEAGLRFCLCSPLWGIYRGAVEEPWSTAHRRGTQPELSGSRRAQENTGPPKQNTFYGNGYIYLHGSQKNHATMTF